MTKHKAQSSRVDADEVVPLEFFDFIIFFIVMIPCTLYLIWYHVSDLSTGIAALNPAQHSFIYYLYSFMVLLYWYFVFARVKVFEMGQRVDRYFRTATIVFISYLILFLISSTQSGFMGVPSLILPVLGTFWMVRTHLIVQEDRSQPIGQQLSNPTFITT